MSNTGRAKKAKEKNKMKSAPKQNLLSSIIDGFVGFFKGKEKEKVVELATSLWPKFNIVCAPDLQHEAREHWNETWKMIVKNEEEGWKRLSEMLMNVTSVETKQTRANDRLHDVKRALDEILKIISDYLKDVDGLDKDLRSLKTATFFEIPLSADSLVSELRDIERRKFELFVREERSKLEQKVREERENIKNEENLLEAQLQTFSPSKGPEQICQSFASKFLNDVEYCQVKYWPQDSISEHERGSSQLLLNFYEVQNNVREAIEADPDYVKNYKLLENCLIIRLHEHKEYGYCREFHNDDHDSSVPSTIRGVHTVLKLQYLYNDGGVQLYDSANQFAGSATHLTLEEKAKNFYYLLAYLSRSPRERLGVLQGFRDAIEATNASL